MHKCLKMVENTKKENKSLFKFYVMQSGKNRYLDKIAYLF